MEPLRPFPDFLEIYNSDDTFVNVTLRDESYVNSVYSALLSSSMGTPSEVQSDSENSDKLAAREKQKKGSLIKRPKVEEVAQNIRNAKIIAIAKPKGGKKRKVPSPEVRSESVDSLVSDNEGDDSPTNKPTGKQNKITPRKDFDHHSLDIDKLRARSDERAKTELQFGLSVEKVRDIYRVFESKIKNNTSKMSRIDLIEMISETKQLLKKNKVHFECEGETNNGTKFIFAESISHFVSRHTRYKNEAKFLKLDDPNRKVMFFATGFSEKFLTFASKVPKLKTVAEAIKNAKIIVA